MRLADRYILRNHVGPFLLGLSVLTFILVIDMLYSFLELFLVNKVPAKVVLELVVLSLGHIFALTIPMAVLVSTMMAFSQMVGENEITALRSGGISLYRLIAAPLVAALALTVFMFLFNNFVLPETNHRLKNLLMAVRSKKPALDIKPGRFIESIPGYTLYVRQKDDVSGELADLLIFKEERGKDPTITSAEHAQFQRDDQQDLLKLGLTEGEQFSADLQRPARMQITVFDRMDILLRDIDRDLQRRDLEHRGDREMSVAMMSEKVLRNEEELQRLDQRLAGEVDTQLGRLVTLIDPAQRKAYLERKGLPATAPASRRGAASRIQDEENTLRSLSNLMLSRDSVERKIRRYQVEIHKKFSIPVACLVFILLGAPVAIKTGRSGTGWGITFSIALFTIYYVFLVGGEELADREFLAPWIAMWMFNLLLLGLGILMLIRTNRESRPYPVVTRIAEWAERRRIAKQARRRGA
ncbi:MAG: LptF/LptG family permease [Candidatus Krumholzibacteriia bacterium]|nr:LptF/LptG family permease [bacterium]MCB9513248.1 LptF/LptG family permease [Candidatus Latescibacterota bacterium]